MTKNRAASGLEKLQKEFAKSYGDEAAAIGGHSKKNLIIPTGSLTLDYELGTGGWELGYLYGVFGPRDIGKSSIIGLNAIREAQNLGLVPAIVAMEPNFDSAWARKHGVDTDTLFLGYPESGEEAFAMLHDLVRSEYVDLVIFDSIGALVGESEIAEGGKARAGGQASLISWGVKVAAPLAYRNKKAVILLNQVRHNMNARTMGTVFQQPGGEALEHHESIIVQLKRGKDRYTVKQNGTEVQIGGTIVAQIHRNKMSEGSGKKAEFDFYSMEVEGYPFGIDTVSDILAVGKRTGVIGVRGAYLDLPDGQTFQGAKAAGEYLTANPKAVEEIRKGVLKAMREREADAREHKSEQQAKSILSVTPKGVEEVAA